MEFDENKVYSEIYLQEEAMIFLECVECGAFLKFKIFLGDGYYLRAFQCEKCSAQKKGVKNDD